MLQMQNGEITLQERPNVEKNSKAPVIQLAPGFTIDDSVLEKPTLLIGQVSSGKSYLLRNAIMPRILRSMRAQDAAVIFATKREMIDGFYHPENGDLLLEYNACKPECIWNIFTEMEASNDPEKTLIELCDVMFAKHKNKVQPFFTNAPKDMFKTLTMYLAETYELQTGRKPTNSTLIGFFDTITLKDTVVNGRTRKGLLTLIKEVPGLHHLSDYLGEGGTGEYRHDGGRSLISAKTPIFWIDIETEPKTPFADLIADGHGVGLLMDVEQDVVRGIARPRIEEGSLLIHADDFKGAYVPHAVAADAPDRGRFPALHHASVPSW